jgi:hypothetical protein
VCLWEAHHDVFSRTCFQFARKKINDLISSDDLDRRVYVFCIYSDSQGRQGNRKRKATSYKNRAKQS